MRYYIIAGEASGDLHGSNLIRELRQLDTAAEIRAWGGDQMQDAGAGLQSSMTDVGGRLGGIPLIGESIRDPFDAASSAGETLQSAGQTEQDLILRAATALGIARSAIECATKHANVREQFGKPILEFQGVGFLLADMVIRWAMGVILGIGR